VEEILVKEDVQMGAPNIFATRLSHADFMLLAMYFVWVPVTLFCLFVCVLFV
jgi:hypothetical protein